MSRRRRAAPPRDHLRVLPGKGQRFAHLRQASIFYIILGLFALLVLLAAYHWLEPFILSRRLQIVTAMTGRLENKLSVEGLLTRPEQLLTAPCTGVIIELAPSGERIPAGADAALIVPLTAEERQKLEQGMKPQENLWEKVKNRFFTAAGIAVETEPAEVPLVTGTLPSSENEKIPLTVPEAGLLLHRIDGWEGLGEKVYRSAEQIAAGAPKDEFEAKIGCWVEQGQPVMKLINNWEWYYNLLLPLDPGRSLAARDNVILEFAFAPDRAVCASLISADIDSTAEEVRLTYFIREQFPGFEDLRWSAAELILEREEGVLIPAAALVEREGETGVFLNRGGAVKFQAITIRSRRDDKLIVEGLEPDSMVITRPGLVEEGRRLN